MYLYRTLPGTQHQFSDVLQMAVEIRWHGHIHDRQDERTESRECPAQEDSCRGKAEGGDTQGSHRKKVVMPSRRREMARRTVADRGISIRLACDLFHISQTCYRQEARQNAENEQIAEWLVRLTDNKRNRGFGLCFLYLRNVKGFKWNHKRVYRIYREFELNLRIKPKKRIEREKPETLTVPETINQDGSMDFMRDPLEDGRSIRLFNVIGDFNREALGIEIDFSMPSERVIRYLEQIIS